MILKVSLVALFAVGFLLGSAGLALGSPSNTKVQSDEFNGPVYYCLQDSILLSHEHNNGADFIAQTIGGKKNQCSSAANPGIVQVQYLSWRIPPGGGPNTLCFGNSSGWVTNSGPNPASAVLVDHFGSTTALPCGEGSYDQLSAHSGAVYLGETEVELLYNSHILFADTI